MKWKQQMSTKIQLSGIGNALVDLQVEATDSDIKALEFAKGTMTLVTTEKQQQLLAYFAHKNPNKCSGGSAANTIVAFSGFGGKASYQSTLGSDELGRFYANEFHQLGILLDKAQVVDSPTGTSFVMITPDAERTMATSLAASAEFSSKHLNEQLIKNSEWVYIEGYKFTDDYSTEAMHKAVEIAKKAGAKVALTFSDVFITELFKEQLEYAVKNADLIFCNEAEALNYTKAENVSQAFKKLTDGNTNLALTMASAGSKVWWLGKEYNFSAYQANPIDSTGAGDMYAAGFLYGIINLQDVDLAGKLGSYSAAKIVSQLGARLNEDHQTLKKTIIESQNKL